MLVSISLFGYIPYIYYFNVSVYFSEMFAEATKMSKSFRIEDFPDVN